MCHCFLIEIKTKRNAVRSVNTAFANGVLTVVNVDLYSPHYSNKCL